ncbi:type I-E CRISPR-associated endonuclease Cas1 [Rhodobacter capsulatus]|uniref:CRISPR-associated endonuclease Cas1 n=1 Tax=Rhodobacter capsulatus TaxID=1061 RepID=A0A4U1JKW6_RHOCA|nr:type I-E CRISPR-associated endonuclease Cas1e [Rhodobacter capsulatus]TKD12518.1 type I-E CRISPR-associated endonuclease Cas1 [Rhodobacter capsulatus]
MSGAGDDAEGQGGPAPSALPGLAPPKPIPLKDRASLVFVEHAKLDVLDGAFVAVNADGTRTQIPVGGLAGIMLEPGARISHAAVALAARVGTLITWVGEGGVRLYSAGQPGGARADRLLWQARIALDDAARLRVVRKMFAMRFGEDAPTRRSIDQLRGIEGVRVRETYAMLAQQHGVDWKRRKYDPADWEAGDTANRCLSAATACLHGLSEAAVLAAGYAPAIGFLHSGKPLSFVYDIADLFKLETVVPEAFRIAGQAAKGKLEMSPDRAVRLACRDAFRRSGLLGRIIPAIEEVLSAGEMPRPEPPPEAMPVAFDEGQSGDAGHRG